MGEVEGRKRSLPEVGKGSVEKKLRPRTVAKYGGISSGLQGSGLWSRHWLNYPQE